MQRRSRIFRHLFLDMAENPQLVFRSFLKVLVHNRVNVTHLLRPPDGPLGHESFAIPRAYTLLVNPVDYIALSEVGPDRVIAELADQFRAFLLTPSGRAYRASCPGGVSFQLAVDTALGLEQNEYYFAWKREPLVGLVGRLDVTVRGERVESFDVPAVPALGLGTLRGVHVRLDRVADDSVCLPRGLSLWITHEAGRLSLLNRSVADATVLVDTVVLPPDQTFPLRNGSRIDVCQDLSLTFTAESPPQGSPASSRAQILVDAPEAPGNSDDGTPSAGSASFLRPARAASPMIPPHAAGTAMQAQEAESDAGEIARPAAPALGRLEVVGSVLTTQMFEHLPGKALRLGSSPQCHVILEGAGVRPVHAELVPKNGALYLANRSGRRAVHYGPLSAPVRPGRRCALTFGDTIRLGGLNLHFQAPFSPISEDMTAYFADNYLGNLMFGEPQARLVVNLDQPQRITIGRDQACDWALGSPFLWPTHAEVLSGGAPRIQPVPDPLAGGRAVIFVNMQDVLEAGRPHDLQSGDHLVIGNLILRYTSGSSPTI